MAEGYSRSPKLLKGALIQFDSALIIPIPNIIIFQYNPESLSRSLSPFDPRTAQAGKWTDAATGQEVEAPTGAPLTQPYDPSESFNLTLLLDATDALEEPESHPVAVVTGVADRISAFEMLLYPAGSSLLGALASAISVSLTGGGGGISVAVAAAKPEPRKEVPVVLFVWGPGRIVPVRLTGFTVDEQQYNQLLYPHRARLTLGLRVVLPHELDKFTNDDTAKDIAKFCYDFTFAQKQILATANIANTVESILGMLPF